MSFIGAHEMILPSIRDPKYVGRFFNVSPLLIRLFFHIASEAFMRKAFMRKPFMHHVHVAKLERMEAVPRRIYSAHWGRLVRSHSDRILRRNKPPIIFSMKV